MCGLVGMAGQLTYKHRDMYKDMLFFNTLRGRDSTGVTAYDMNRNEVETKKATVPGYEFIQSPWIDSLLTTGPAVWLGHGRHKTVGTISRLNAHPFEVRTADDKISMFGAHNGTLTNKWDMEKLMKDSYGTDSEAFLNLIAERGPKAAIAEARGAWALSWWTSEDNSINLIRNAERPLCYSYTDDMKALIWASEPWMIRIAAMRAGVDLVQNDKKNEVIYSLFENKLFKWPLPSFKGSKEEDNSFSAPTQEGGLLGKPVEEKKFQPHTGNWWGSGASLADDDIWDGEGTYRLPARTIPQTEAKDGETTKAPAKADKDHVVGFEGQLINRQIAEELRKAGCDWCGKPDIANGYAWLDDMNLVCLDCLHGTHVKIDVENNTIVERVLGLVTSRAPKVDPIISVPKKKGVK